MATTTATLVGTGESVARGAGTAWTNPGNITADDTSYATCASGSSGSAYLVARNLGFSIPTGATIDGVTVVVNGSEHSAGSETVSAQLQDDSAALVGSAKTLSWTGTAKTNYTYGGSADKWGATLTPAIVNDPDFGVRIWYTTTHSVEVDYVTIEVTYTPAAGGTPPTVAYSGYNNGAFGSTSNTISSYAHPGGAIVVVAILNGSGVVTGITANGTALTLMGSRTAVYDENKQYVYYHNNLGSFTGNIVVSYDTDVYYHDAQAYSFSGADSTPFSGFNSGAGSSTSPTVTISSASDSLVVACISNSDTSTTHTIGSGQTLIREDVGTNGTDATLKHRVVATYETGAASVVMDGTLSASENWSAVGFSVKGTTASAAARDPFGMMGFFGI